MVKRVVLALIVVLMAAGSAFGQVRLWWWGRAQITPYERSWDTANTVDGNQETGYMNAYIWWSRFGVNGNHGGTVGFEAETATMLTDTGDINSVLGHYWANWPDFWVYNLWYKPATWLSLKVGKYNSHNEGSAWVMDFFDRTRYSVVGLGEDEFFAGYDNVVQANPGASPASGTAVPAGALLEGFFGPFTVSLNLKGIDAQMNPIDYLQTVQLGVRYDAPGLGFFRAQIIGFDPEGKITGNFLKVNNATSQIQAAANITGIPGMEFRIGFHYFLSTSLTNWVDGLDADYNFDADKGAIGIPFGFELNIFNPLTFRLVGHFQLGKEKTYGQDIWTLKGSFQTKYVIGSNLTALLNISAYNFGDYLNSSVDGGDISYFMDSRPMAIDFGLGIQTNLRGAHIQTGIIIQYHTEKDAQLGIAIPFIFDFGF